MIAILVVLCNNHFNLFSLSSNNCFVRLWTYAHMYYLLFVFYSDLLSRGMKLNQNIIDKKLIKQGIELNKKFISSSTILSIFHICRYFYIFHKCINIHSLSIDLNK